MSSWLYSLSFSLIVFQRKHIENMFFFFFWNPYFPINCLLSVMWEQYLSHFISNNQCPCKIHIFSDIISAPFQIPAHWFLLLLKLQNCWQEKELIFFLPLTYCVALVSAFPPLPDISWQSNADLDTKIDCYQEHCRHWKE